MMRALNSPAISLRVSGIWSAGAGRRACSVAAAMVRKAAAGMARVVHRYQKDQRRTWCSSSSAKKAFAVSFRRFGALLYGLSGTDSPGERSK